VTRAVIFDLYGTLLEIGEPVFQERLPRLEGISRRDWIEFQRSDLLVLPFPTRAAFVEAIFARFGGGGAELAATLGELLERELASVRPIAGAASLLAFLDRRGLALGLITNSASPYREPFERLGLSAWFDAVLFSCDAGARKPDERLYRDALAAMGVEAGAALMVGDSAANDVRAPARAGLRGLLVGTSATVRAVPRLADVGWLDLDTLEPLAPAGAELELGGERGRLSALEPLADDEQGRYNLVARATLAAASGARRVVYLKRFLFPESIEVELAMSELAAEAGVETCACAAFGVAERLLVIAAAPGAKLEAPRPEAPYAREVGRHAAIAYIFANADLRPRNAFLAGAGAAQRLTMVDYEHCLLNLAIDLEGIPDPLDRDAFEALGRVEIERRVARRVLADAHMQRAYRAFLGPFARDAALADAFRAGWSEVHGRAQERRGAIVDRLEARLAADPPLVVGTHAYRRAFLRLDLEDLLARLDEEPARARERCFRG
jgi:HAD superfamily hydrolase (TIGR01509 family)